MRDIVAGLLVTFALTACVQFPAPTEFAEPGYYYAQPGENLDSIAFALLITPERLSEANPWLNPVNIAPGMRLKLPQQVYQADYATHGDYQEEPAWGDNTAQYSGQSSDFIWPVANPDISSRFGQRRGRLHAGIDLRAPRGTAIRASASGRVSFAGRKRGYGRLVILDHGGSIKTLYAHNSRNLVRQGQAVEQGEVIATVGQSGNATGNHLHFEIRRQGKAVNPRRQLRTTILNTASQ